MRPVSSASGMKCAGRHHAVLGMAPAHQRLDAAELARADVDDRLVVQFELAAREAEPQIGLDLVALGDRLRHARVEEA